MALYAGEIDIRCDGCGKKLDETTDVYGSCCRSAITIAAAESLKSISKIVEEAYDEVKECRAAIDALLSGPLIVQAHARDTLESVSERLGKLAS